MLQNTIFRKNEVGNISPLGFRKFINFAIRFDDFLKMLEAPFEMWPFLMKDSEYTQWRAFHKNQFILENINQNIKRTRD